MSDSAPQDSGRSLLRTTLISALGGVFEFYDFVIFAVFAPQIGAAFFPPEAGESAQTLKAFLVFAVGYLARPIGGLLWAHVADRKGRAYVFSHTVIGMALATMSIALLPGYQTIGDAAPVLLVLLRLLQGMTLGGELPASLCWLAEHAGDRKKGLATATLMAGVNSGMLLGQSVAAALTFALGEQAMVSWGWRLAFVLGSVVGIVAWAVRRHVGETREFARLQQDGLIERTPLKALLRTSRKEALRAACLCAVHAWVVATLYLALPSYLHEMTGMPLQQAERIALVSSATGSLLYLAAGFAADFTSASRVCRFALGLLALLSVPAYLMTNGAGYWPLLAIGAIGGVFIGGYLGILPSLFAANVRSSGLALGYDGAFAVVGGLGPFLMLWLSKNCGPIAVGAVTAALAIIAIAALPRDGAKSRA